MNAFNPNPERERRSNVRVKGCFGFGKRDWHRGVPHLLALGVRGGSRRSPSFARVSRSGRARRPARKLAQRAKPSPDCKGGVFFLRTDTPSLRAGLGFGLAALAFTRARFAFG